MKELVPKSWLPFLAEEFDKEYFKKLESFIERELQDETVYPPKEQIFEALRLCPFERVKIVIVGQDPYHGPDQAHGLAFSVQKGVKLPPSLKNIYKELAKDLGLSPPDHGNLEAWAKQGVLLLNAALTVRRGEPGSHRKKGWEIFTDKVVQILNDKKDHVVFILWGNYAKEKGSRIDRAKHCVLESAHPSPFSASKFFGNRHFSKANRFLESKMSGQVNWELAEAAHK